MKKIALITGATSGIGRATAIALADEGYNLILTGRRKERLDELKELVAITYKADALVLNFDVRNPEEVAQAVASIPAAWRKIDVLVNNAGLAVGLNPIQEGLLEDWERMIDTNIKGLLYMTREIAPLMCERGVGHIVNICITPSQSFVCWELILITLTFSSHSSAKVWSVYIHMECFRQNRYTFITSLYLRICFRGDSNVISCIRKICFYLLIARYNSECQRKRT